VSPSAVSQQIRLLESQFGVKLFRREKRRLTLTLDGDRLFQTTTQVFAAIRNARRAIGRQHDQRGLIFRVSPSFGVRWLGPRIAGFAAEHPDWAIRIDATPDFTDFETEIVDFDLRYGLGGWAGLTVKPVMRDLVLPLCSPEFLARLSRIEDPVARLGDAPLIDSVKTLCRWDLWLATNRIELPEPAYPFRFDRSSMSIEMAKQGGGVALDSAMLCKPELERGELTPFAPEIPAVEFPAYWFVCPPRRMNRRIVARFADWVAAEASVHEAEVRAILERLGCAVRPAADPQLFA
ncbi:MAG: LysR substrate-binding domain-containing protein, partial [Pseudomonadota bacterium]